MPKCVLFNYMCKLFNYISIIYKYDHYTLTNILFFSGFPYLFILLFKKSKFHQGIFKSLLRIVFYLYFLNISSHHKQKLCSN